ncbi:MAG: group 1 truncated hemoglobin [Alphaproteobacteria bacterium]|nr:group 1 truncated hemoglobin [Alphaproteobacteria bacterium]MCB9930806.1 group 1 truncated hemoglobin [Alphaproteobacteria bacterium]
MASIFEKYGGFVTVSKIVMDFYDRVLDSDTAGPFFDDVDMRRQIDHQTKFIAQVMGGPAAYSNDALRRVHSHLAIDRAAFDEVAGLLEATLLEHGVDPEDVAAVMAEIHGRAHLVITTA